MIYIVIDFDDVVMANSANES